MPADLATEIILAMGLFEASLLCRECRWRSPFNHTPPVRLAMGGSGPISVGAHGLVCPDCPSAEPPMQPAITIDNNSVLVIFCNFQIKRPRGNKGLRGGIRK